MQRCVVKWCKHTENYGQSWLVEITLESIILANDLLTKIKRIGKDVYVFRLKIHNKQMCN